MKTNLRNLCLAIGTSMVIAACGGGAEAPEAAEPEAESVSEDQPSGICGMLTPDQVATVLPDSDGGDEKDTSEASLLRDIEMEHCQYLLVEGMDVKFLDLIIYKASSDEAFQQIALAEGAREGRSRRLDIGDIGYLHDMSSQGEMVATASKGRTLFELKLIASDAGTKSEQLIDLARIVAGQI
ncbi:MAG TPA: hypothetical protein VIL33_00355 [Rhodothermia bacterium]